MLLIWKNTYDVNLMKVVLYINYGFNVKNKSVYTRTCCRSNCNCICNCCSCEGAEELCPLPPPLLRTPDNWDSNSAIGSIPSRLLGLNPPDELKCMLDLQVQWYSNEHYLRWSDDGKNLFIIMSISNSHKRKNISNWCNSAYICINYTDISL